MDKGVPTKPGETFTRGARKLVFSAVPNIPGSRVPKEATQALSAATFPYIRDLVSAMREKGGGEYHALLESKELQAGLMTWQGKLYNLPVAIKLGLTNPSQYNDISQLFRL